MMSDEKINMAEYVEGQISRITFKAKNFTLDEMDYVDKYCQERYDNNRKLMILDLIKYKEENLSFELLNEKINYIYHELHNKIQALNPEEKKEEPSEIKAKWKGFKN